MSVEQYGNIYPKIQEHIDARLASVSNIANLPDPTIASNFIYEGAIAYVKNPTAAYYKCVYNTTSGLLEWVPFNTANLVIGSINIVPGTTVLDLSLVSPAIANCYAVEINIVGGTSATIQAITNMPGNDKLLTLFTKIGQQVTYKHTNYDIASTDQIVLEVGFDMVIKGRAIGNESLTIKKHGIANCQWDATQFVKSTDWIQNLLSQTVVDNLTTQNTSTPLSANQGYILNNLINGKQQILSAGQKIQLTPGVSNTVIDSLPRDWVNTVIMASPAPSANTASFIAGNISPTTISHEYRYVDLRGLPAAAGGDRGLWLLSPGKNPTVAGNWINIDAPLSSRWATYFKYTAQTGINSSLISNKYYPRIDVSSAIGPTTSINFNTDGPTNEKVSTQLALTRSNFLVHYNIILSVNDTSNRQFFLEFYTTNGLQSSANPTNTGQLRRTVPSGEGSSPISGRQIQLTGFFHIATGSVAGANDTFTLALREISNSFSNVNILADSAVEIIKI